MLENNTELLKFIGDKVSYDCEGGIIWGHSGGYLTRLLDVRGWSAIQNMDLKDPMGFQDNLGEWIADAINQKLKYEKKTK